jgi:hypothetical protein
MLQPKRAGIKKIYLLLAFAFCLFTFLGCNRNVLTETGQSNTDLKKESPQERGEQIVSEYLRRDAAPCRKSRVRLTINSPEEPTKIYVLDVWRKQTDSQTLTLTQFVEPKEERDLGSLTIEQKGKPTVNVTYIASTGQFRESGTNKLFFGGLTAQELLGEWDKYESSMLSEKENGGAKFFEVESRLKPDADSVIKRMITLFRAEDYLPVEARLFDGQSKELRTFRVTDTREVEGRKVVWRTEIENHIYKSKILIELLSMSFAEKIPDQAFEREYLKKIAQK